MGTCFSKAKKKKNAGISRQKTEQPLPQHKQDCYHHLLLPRDQEHKISSAIAELPEREFTLSDKHVVENCGQEAPAMAAAAPHPPLLNRTECCSSPNVLFSLHPILFEPQTSSFSPLNRSPSARTAHETSTDGLVRTLSIKAGLRSPPSKLLYITEDSLCTPRSRSLPKRFYSRNQPELDGAFHKRSSSRDSTVQALLAGRKSLRRIPSMDCRLDNGFSPRVSVRREEASSDYRIYARHAAAGRNSHSYETRSISTDLDYPKSRRKEKSPLRRSSTGKVADADQFSYRQDDLSVQTRQAGAKRHDHTSGRSALKDKSVNCSYGWDSVAKQVGKALPQAVQIDEQKHCCEEFKKADIDEEGLCKQLLQVQSFYEEPPHTVNGLDPVMVYEASSLPRSLHSPQPVLNGNASITHLASEMPNARPSSTTKAAADLNLPNSLYSEAEDSDNEVGVDTFDLLQLALGPDESPKMDLEAQQARNLLLKEAAMEAFARPRFHSTTKHYDLKVQQSKTCGMADLIAMRQKEAEADTLKTRNLLKLLCMAEPAMRPEQKTTFYSKLRMLLDSAGISDLAEESKVTNDGDGVFGMTGGGRFLTARVNSWPRIVKQPVQINSANMSSVPKNNAEQALATEFLATVNNDLNHDNAFSEAVRHFPVTAHDDLLPEPYLADYFTGERIKGHALKSQELKLTRDNHMQTFVPAIKNINEGKLMRSNLQTDQVSGISLSDQAIEQSTNARDSSSIVENHVDIAFPAEGAPLISTQETERESFNDIGQLKPVGALAFIEVDHSRDVFASHEAEESNKSSYESTEDNQLDLEDFNCESKDAEPKTITVEEPKDQLDVKRQQISSSTLLVSDNSFHSRILQPAATTECIANARLDQDSIACDSSSIRKSQSCANLAEDRELPHNVIDAFVNSTSKPSRPSDVASDSSFEFRVRSNASTPLSTPSTPMISTASTPRQLSDLNRALTAEGIAEIWDAFE